MAEKAGYSGKSLAAKLGVNPSMTMRVLAAPMDYDALTGLSEAGAVAVDDGPASLVHLFVLDHAALVRDLPSAMAALAPGAMLWISWPKKASPLFRDLTEDGIRQVVLPT